MPKAKGFKSKSVFIAKIICLVLIVKIVLFAIDRYKKAPEPQKQLGDIVNYKITENLLIKTSIGNDPVNLISPKILKRVSLGTFPSEYYPKKLKASSEDKVIKVDEVRFRLTLKNHFIMDEEKSYSKFGYDYENVTRGNEADIVIEKLNPEKDLETPEIRFAEKNHLNTAISKFYSELTLMDCQVGSVVNGKVQHYYNMDKIRPIVCESDSVKNGLPPVIFFRSVEKRNDKFDSDVFPIRTKSEKLGIVVYYRLNYWNIHKWQEIHQKTFELIETWNVETTENKLG